MPVTSTGYRLNKQPIAQSFFVDERNGVYCTKIDLYFQAKPTTGSALPVQVQLRPMLNGYPSSSQIIPGSIVTKAASAVNADTTGPELTPTTFEFDEPVFLKGKEDFAIVVIADSLDYLIYIAEMDQFTFGATSKRINKQPTLGSLFYSQNGATFTASQNQDLAFRLHQAKFTNTRGTAIFHNASLAQRRLFRDPIVTTNGDATVRVKHRSSGLNISDKVSIRGIPTAGVGGISKANLEGSRTITAVDYTGYTFEAGAAASADAVGGGDSCFATNHIPFNLAYPHAQILQPKDTFVATAFKPVTTRSYVRDTSIPINKLSDFQALQRNKNNISDRRFVVMSDSNENILFSDTTTKSLDFRVNLSTIDSNVSPMIDTQRMSMTLCDNIIDKQDSAINSAAFNTPLVFGSEDSAAGGSSAARHFTRVVELEEDAVGLKILLSANRPNEADFQIYFRTATSDEDIRTKNFTLAPAENVIPSSESKEVFRQYTYLIGGTGGNLIPAFTKYQIKIVMRSTNQAKVPLIRDLRIIALAV